MSSVLESVDKEISVNTGWDVWYKRLGHPQFNSLKKSLSSCTSLNANENTKVSFCKICQLGKLHRLNFKSTEIKTIEPLQIVHSDLWRSAFDLSNQGYRYYIAFVDKKNKLYIDLSPKK